MYNKKWYDQLKKSYYTPPSIIFSIVWPILYILMTISFYIIYKDDKCQPYCSPLTYFLLQLILNLSWTTVFFKYKKIKIAFITIIIIIGLTFKTIKDFYKINKIAGYLLIPYIIWLTFALYLNYYIISNN